MERSWLDGRVSDRHRAVGAKAIRLVVAGPPQLKIRGRERAVMDRAHGRLREVPVSSTQRAIWEREMRRLSIGRRVLFAVLLALGARVIVSGLNFASGLSLAVVAALFVASLVLTRQGRRLQPSQASGAERSREPPGRCVSPRT